jgi:hypothetical protein
MTLTYQNGGDCVAKNKDEVRKQSEEENRQRDELNDYLIKEIFRYGDDKALPRFLWVRINALRTGQTYQRTGMKNQHIYYGFDTILLTFKFCKLDIIRCLDTMQFNNEAHKINTIMKIIDYNINTVVDMLKNAKRVDEKIENRDMSLFQNLEIDEKESLVESNENRDTEIDSKWEGLW